MDYVKSIVENARKRPGTGASDEALDRALNAKEVQELNVEATMMCQMAMLAPAATEDQRVTDKGEMYDIKLANRLSAIMRDWHAIGLRPSRFFPRRDILPGDEKTNITINSLKQAFAVFVQDVGYVPDFPETDECASCTGRVIKKA